MTKNKFIAIAVYLAVHSAVLSGNILRTGQLNPYADQGLGILPVHIFSFLVLSLLALTVKQKVWRTGAILAALAVLIRSCIACFPDQKYTFAMITLFISSASIAALLASWRLETFDFSWWDRNRGRNTFKPAYIVIVLLAIAGIFLYWGRS